MENRLRDFLKEFKADEAKVAEIKKTFNEGFDRITEKMIKEKGDLATLETAKEQIQTSGELNRQIFGMICGHTFEELNIEKVEAEIKPRLEGLTVSEQMDQMKLIGEKYAVDAEAFGTFLKENAEELAMEMFRVSMLIAATLKGL